MTIAGDRYLKVRHVNLMPEVSDMKVYALNLFTGSDELSEYSGVRFRYSVTDTDRTAFRYKVNVATKEHTASVFKDFTFIP